MNEVASPVIELKFDTGGTVDGHAGKTERHAPEAAMMEEFSRNRLIDRVPRLAARVSERSVEQ